MISIRIPYHIYFLDREISLRETTVNVSEVKVCILHKQMLLQMYAVYIVMIYWLSMLNLAFKIRIKNEIQYTLSVVNLFKTVRAPFVMRCHSTQYQMGDLELPLARGRSGGYRSPLGYSMNRLCWV